jgi:quinol monooxygenase YgiN
MMRKTQEEAGCISYVFSADLSEPGVFRLFEEWESDEALGAHMKSPHMAEFQSVVATLGIKEAVIQRYEVSSVGPL